jgi:hypothetical protein
MVVTTCFLSRDVPKGGADGAFVEYVGWQNELPIATQPGWRPPRPLVVIAIGLAVAALVAAWWWSYTSEGRALRALPAAERRALYQRNIDTLREVCEPAPPRSLRTLCRDHAHRVLEFPECDADCREVARRMLVTPMR